MRSLSMTAGNDNTIVWVFQILLDSTTIYLSTQDISLTNSYDGKVLMFNQYDETVSDGEISYSGGISVLGSMNMIISSETDNTNFDSWFNEYYPNNSTYLMNRKVKLGIVWNTATSDSQITWLSELKIIDYKYADRRTELTLDANNEFVNVNIPYYTIQDNYDDGISYIDFASSDEKNTVIPVLYGDFSVTGIGINYTVSRLAKCVLFNKSLLHYKYAYHPCYSDDANNRLYKSVNGSKSFMIMEADTSVKTNNQTGSSIQLNPVTRTYGEKILGSLSLSNFVSGSESDIIDFTELNDYDSSNYITVPAGDQVSFKIDGNISTSDTGMLSPLQNSYIQFQIYAKVASGSGQGDLYYWSERGYSGNNAIAVTTTLTGFSMSIGTSTSVKPNANLPWTLEELCSVEYVLKNDGATDIQIQRALLVINGIVIQQYYSTYKGEKVKIKVSRG